MENLRDKVVFIKNSCEDKYGNIQKYIDPEVQLYIVFGYECNADCDYCVYHTKQEGSKTKNVVDPVKFAKLLDALNDNNITISDIHITGGEPTLDFDNFVEILKIIKEKSRKWSKVTVNTNGINLNRMGYLVNTRLLNCIALSRHAIDDKENEEIFKTSDIPQLEDIRQFNGDNKRGLHLSCNLINGHIDSQEKVKDYLEMAADLGVFDVGFIGLMPKNEYCKQQFVDFRQLDIENIPNVMKTMTHINRDDSIIKDGKPAGEILCTCQNYLYKSSDNRLVSFYHRFAVQSKQIVSMLVFSDNKLRLGFNGDIILEL